MKNQTKDQPDKPDHNERTVSFTLDFDFTPRNNKLLSFLHTVGIMLAVDMSYKANQSILWAIVHGFFNWFYVFYNLITSS